MILFCFLNNKNCVYLKSFVSFSNLSDTSVYKEEADFFSFEKRFSFLVSRSPDVRENATGCEREEHFLLIMHFFHYKSK